MNCAHNILTVGVPGGGKTLLARSLPSIMPRLTIDEALDITRIYSVSDMLPLIHPSSAIAHFGPRTTPSATPGWWAAAAGLAPVRSAWPIGASSSFIIHRK